jgi:hypothetical protein
MFKMNDQNNDGGGGGDDDDNDSTDCHVRVVRTLVLIREIPVSNVECETGILVLS